MEVVQRILSPSSGKDVLLRIFDHSFSFNYDRKSCPFPDSMIYCGEFARKVIGSSREIPPVEFPIAKNLYQTWVCKEVQGRLSSIS